MAQGGAAGKNLYQHFWYHVLHKHVYLQLFMTYTIYLFYLIIFIFKIVFIHIYKLHIYQLYKQLYCLFSSSVILRFYII